MAFVSAGYFVDIVFQDTGANQTSRRMKVKGATYVAALANAIAARNAIAAASDAAIVSMTMSEKFYDDAFVAPTDPEVQVEVNAELVLQNAADLTKHPTWYLPSPKAAVWQAATGKQSNYVKLDEAIVVAVANIFNVTDGYVYISDGEQTIKDTILDGWRVTRRNRQG